MFARLSTTRRTRAETQHQPTPEAQSPHRRLQLGPPTPESNASRSAPEANSAAAAPTQSSPRPAPAREPSRWDGVGDVRLGVRQRQPLLAGYRSGSSASRPRTRPANPPTRLPASPVHPAAARQGRVSSVEGDLVCASTIETERGVLAEADPVPLGADCPGADQTGSERPPRPRPTQRRPRAPQRTRHPTRPHQQGCWRRYRHPLPRLDAAADARITPQAGPARHRSAKRPAPGQPEPETPSRLASEPKRNPPTRRVPPHRQAAALPGLAPSSAE
ncbi:hypothetical protein SAMN04487983_1016111 [Streptomyces sp. yr375]|nr:hypothetical protein SAMN04487983_1016111 [Streptomyces sp. yr375]